MSAGVMAPSPFWNIRPASSAESQTACAQLYRSGVYVTKQCHSIY